MQQEVTTMSEPKVASALEVPEFISKQNRLYVQALLEQAARMQRGKQNKDPVCISDLVSEEGPDGQQLQYVHLVLAGVCDIRHCRSQCASTHN
jgi:hypothetical protein